MIDTLQTVILRRKAENRISSGHVWIFSNELEDGFQQIPPGSIAEVRDSRGRIVGMGTVNPHSLITVRLLSHTVEPVDAGWLRTRLLAAVSLRGLVYGADTTSCRMVYSESDGLPGLIVDRIDDLLMVQSTTAGMDALMPRILPVLADIFQPTAIIAANDSPMREREGLALSREVVWGRWEGPKAFTQDGIHLLVDPIGGQKTSFYFDQRLNRQAVARMIRSGHTVLDLFSYTGGFGLYCLKAGAEHVTFVDASESALEFAREMVERNGWLDRAEFIKADIFPYIKDSGLAADIVMVDPPALVKSRTKVPAALRAYRDLNARAISLVKPGGLFVSSSCSGLVKPEVWLEVLCDAAFKSYRCFRILHKAGQSPDHPVLSTMPETEYLKFAIGTVD